MNRYRRLQPKTLDLRPPNECIKNLLTGKCHRGKPESIVCLMQFARLWIWMQMRKQMQMMLVEAQPRTKVFVQQSKPKVAGQGAWPNAPVWGQGSGSFGSLLMTTICMSSPLGACYQPAIHPSLHRRSCACSPFLRISVCFWFPIFSFLFSSFFSAALYSAFFGQGFLPFYFFVGLLSAISRYWPFPHTTHRRVQKNIAQKVTRKYISSAGLTHLWSFSKQSNLFLEFIIKNGSKNRRIYICREALINNYISPIYRKRMGVYFGGL